MRLTDRVKKFLIVGSSAAVVNFILMIIFVELFLFKTYFLKNLANILSMEISIFYNFLFSCLWTWGDAPKRSGKGLIAQFASFNLAALTGVSIRIIVFAILEKFGIFYLLNLAIGIGLAATVDFILYDKLIFRRAIDGKETL